MKSRDFSGEVTDIAVSDVNSKIVDTDEHVNMNQECESGSITSPSGSTGVDKQNDSTTCENNNNNKNNIFNCNVSRKLTFGIESILRENSKPVTDNRKCYRVASAVISDEKLNHYTNNNDDETEVLGVYNTSDDDEPEDNDFTVQPTDFEVENARARLAFFRYSTRFSVFNNNPGNCLRPGSAQQPVFQPHSFPVTNPGDGFVWPSVAATTTDGRKDRFGCKFDLLQENKISCSSVMKKK